MAVPKPPVHWPWQCRNGAPSRQPTEAVEAPMVTGPAGAWVAL